MKLVVGTYMYVGPTLYKLRFICHISWQIHVLGDSLLATDNEYIYMYII